MNNINIVFLGTTNEGLFRVQVPDEIKDQFLAGANTELEGNALVATELEFGGDGVSDRFKQMFAIYGPSEEHVNAFSNGIEFAYDNLKSN